MRMHFSTWSPKVFSREVKKEKLEQLEASTRSVVQPFARAGFGCPEHPQQEHPELQKAFGVPRPAGDAGGSSGGRIDPSFARGAVKPYCQEQIRPSFPTKQNKLADSSPGSPWPVISMRFAAFPALKSLFR